MDFSCSFSEDTDGTGMVVFIADGVDSEATAIRFSMALFSALRSAIKETFGEESLASFDEMARMPLAVEANRKPH